MRVRILIVGLVVMLAGCATAPEPMPPPDPPLLVCDIDPALTENETEPDRPINADDTQRDVALYITALHQWATQGWERVKAIRQRSEDCVRREDL